MSNSSERDPITGQLLLGATISPRHHYNLAQLSLAWRPDVEAEPEFAQFVEGIKAGIRGVRVAMWQLLSRGA